MVRALWIFWAGLLLQAQAPDNRGPAFEVASVKLLGAGERKVPLFSGGPDSSDPGRLHLRVNMSLLLGAAFGVSVDQIKGPAWLRDFSAMPFYDIVATMPAYSSRKQVEKMLQSLLAERFQLVFHHETGHFPGYELVVDRGGPKLKEVVPDPDPTVDPQAVRGAPAGPDGFPIIRGRRTSASGQGNVSQRIKDQEWTMADLARQLGFLIGRSEGKSLDDGFFQPRVIDKTGLTGRYTFILEFDCPGCVVPTPSAPANPQGGTTGNAVDDSPSFPNLFAAVQRELGLRLIKTADVEMDVIVLDALNRIPIEN